MSVCDVSHTRNGRRRSRAEAHVRFKTVVLGSLTREPDALAGMVAYGGVALGGFAVVAYQTLPASANGTRGSASFAYNLTSSDASNATVKMQPTAYTFHFASAANRDSFAKDPWSYTPAWGGF